jgi:DNA-binding MarR family transcriptional regulator
MDPRGDTKTREDRAAQAQGDGAVDARSARERSPRAAIPRDGREQAVIALWSDLTHAADVVRARLAALLEAGPGLSPEDVELLMLLAAAPEGRLRMIDVSESLRLSKSGVTRLVDRLQERGLVLRAACPSDRRVVYAGLTEQGALAVEAAAPVFVAGLMEHLGGRLEEVQLARLRGDLRRIAGSQVASVAGDDTKARSAAGGAATDESAAGGDAKAGP